jgi:hypothetical protein
MPKVPYLDLSLDPRMFSGIFFVFARSGGTGEFPGILPWLLKPFQPFGSLPVLQIGREGAGLSSFFHLFQLSYWIPDRSEKAGRSQ